ncbi:hypothetical protein FQN50_003951 [Emmonsiellopsis sp. PD_5]|nr:hypothetical protein FQN50_003951 [Emmonsiellopsis sp. PD_5]
MQTLLDLLENAHNLIVGIFEFHDSMLASFSHADEQTYNEQFFGILEQLSPILEMILQTCAFALAELDDRDPLSHPDLCRFATRPRFDQNLRSLHPSAPHTANEDEEDGLDFHADLSHIASDASEDNAEEADGEDYEGSPAGTSIREASDPHA